MPLTHATYISDVDNVRIIELYQRYKLSDVKYALTDVTSYAVPGGPKKRGHSTFSQIS